MKRIIDGRSYNTDTATCVAAVRRGPDDSYPFEHLYQTRHGAFFRYGMDETCDDGPEILPATDAEAQAFLEKYANHLVEQYFGAMPEAGAAERRLTIRVPGNLAERAEAVASAKGLSLNAYVMRCLEHSVAGDGQPPRPS
jgi:predicted HicB family RNase H-like nuclease